MARRPRRDAIEELVKMVTRPYQDFPTVPHRNDIVELMEADKFG